DLEERSMKHYIDHSLAISDHVPVVIEIVDDSAPETGRGRWKMTTEDLKDKYLMEEIRKIMNKCDKEGNKTPVKSWLDSKRKIRNLTESRQATCRKERGAHLADLKKQQNDLTRRTDFKTNIGLQNQESKIRDEIARIERTKLDRAAESALARYADKGESVNKYWFAIGRAVQESSIIRTLQRPDDQPATDTEKMLQIARAHDEALQSEPAMTASREEAIEEMKRTTSGKEMTLESVEILKADLKTEEARKAIKGAQNGKAPGKDGIPYEFYKYWVKHLEENKDEDTKIPDIARILTRAWNEVSEDQPAPEEYVQGLMFLLHKKKERDKIQNYRPITLLNSDYKLQTKAMTNRLRECVDNVIHPDQAEFVPGRDILDHVKLAKVVKEYCDTEEVDGCLVALDQEKAYDKIDHKYMWEIL
ncbi:hypothetical protein FRC01_003327, partial [Tulasnella sp. 417]